MAEAITKTRKYKVENFPYYLIKGVKVSEMSNIHI